MEADAMFRALVETSPDAILVQQGPRLVYANPSAARLFGAGSPAELVGRLVADLVAPVDRGAVAERAGRAGRVGAGLPHDRLAVHSLRRVDGGELRAEVHAAPFAAGGEDGTPLTLLTLRDLSEVAWLREEALRLNRAHGVLSACSDALARAGDEPALLAEVCRILVERGGFALAWVGAVEADAARSIRPLAAHGRDGGLIQALRPASADGPDPAGAALRARRPVRVEGGGPFPGWAAAALQRGLSASIVLPLVAREPLGVLCLHAEERDALDPAIVELLRQLADGLAHGLVALRARELLAGVLEHAPVQIAVLTADRRLLLSNRAATEFLREVAGDLVAPGHDLDEIFPPEVVAPGREAVAEVLRTGAPVRRKAAIPLRGGARHLDAIYFPLRHAAEEVVAVVAADVTAREEAEQALRASRGELRALAARSDQAREGEKAHIARELYDDLAQLLSAAKMDLRWLERRVGGSCAGSGAGLAERTRAAARLIDAAAASIQRLAPGLRPTALDRLGLAEALRQEARRFAERTGVACEVAVAGPPVTGEAATALYRIAEEALANVARHAHAARVMVRVGEEGGALVLRVEDDGRGLGAAPPPAALGIPEMRERAERLGGRLTVEGRAGGGTSVTARIPPRGGRREEGA
jgi:PAS domain S-box-containing protein